MRVFTVGMAVLGTVIAGQASAGHAAGTDKKVEASQNKERVVCRSTMKTGTRFEKRICKTVAEWDELAEKNADLWREQLARPQINPAEKP